MTEPASGEFVISQGDSLPVMRIVVPANSAGQLIDLTGCTVTFLGRPLGSRILPPPVVRPIQSFAQESVDGTEAICVYVALEPNDTRALAVPVNQSYVEMQGELEVVDAAGGVLTIPTLGYMRWWVRDDIGDGAVF